MSEAEVHQLPPAIVSMLKPMRNRLVLHRRGSTVRHVCTERAQYAVKLGWPIEASDHWPAVDWTALAPAREGVILRELGCGAATYGAWEKGTWNMQPWHDGTDLHELWAQYRTRTGLADPPLRDALACARALADLHAKGYAHGDVQPAHFILGSESTGAALIDLALAHGAEVPPRFDFPYRGCLVHYESPEVSRRVLEDGEAVPTQEADVYGLGATLLMAATGWRHVEYPDDASRAVQRRAVVDGAHRPVNVAEPLGVLINEMLRPESSDRPTAGEIAKELEQSAG